MIDNQARSTTNGPLNRSHETVSSVGKEVITVTKVKGDVAMMKLMVLVCLQISAD